MNADRIPTKLSSQSCIYEVSYSPNGDISPMARIPHTAIIFIIESISSLLVFLTRHIQASVVHRPLAAYEHQQQLTRQHWFTTGPKGRSCYCTTTPVVGGFFGHTHTSRSQIFLGFTVIPQHQHSPALTHCNLAQNSSHRGREQEHFALKHTFCDNISRLHVECNQLRFN